MPDKDKMILYDDYDTYGGLSGLSDKQLSGFGGLENVQNAAAIARALEPEEESFDGKIAALKYFQKMGELAAQPGATFLGSATGALNAPVAYYTDSLIKNKSSGKNRTKNTLEIASKIKPKKGSGVGKNYTKGVAALDENGETIRNANGSLMYNYQVKDNAGNFIRNEVRPDPSTQKKTTNSKRTLYKPDGSSVEVYTPRELKEALTQGFDTVKPGAVNNDAFDQETKLRNEFNKSSKDFIKVRDATGRLLAAADQPSAAGDLAMIFNYMKILDPGSTVREGEFATAQNSGGLDDTIRARYNSVIDGTRLTADQREDFTNRGIKLYNAQELTHLGSKEYYEETANAYSLDPSRVVQDFTLEKPEIKEEEAPLLEQLSGSGSAVSSNGIDPTMTAIQATILLGGASKSELDALRKRPGFSNLPDEILTVFEQVYNLQSR